MSLYLFPSIWNSVWHLSSAHEKRREYYNYFSSVIRGKGDKEYTCSNLTGNHLLIYKLMNHIAKRSLYQMIKQFQSDFREKDSDKDTVKAV